MSKRPMDPAGAMAIVDSILYFKRQELSDDEQVKLGFVREVLLLLKEPLSEDKLVGMYANDDDASGMYTVGLALWPNYGEETEAEIVKNFSDEMWGFYLNARQERASADDI